MLLAVLRELFSIGLGGLRGRESGGNTQTIRLARMALNLRQCGRRPKLKQSGSQLKFIIRLPAQCGQRPKLKQSQAGLSSSSLETSLKQSGSSRLPASTHRSAASQEASSNYPNVPPTWVPFGLVRRKSMNRPYIFALARSRVVLGQAGSPPSSVRLSSALPHGNYACRCLRSETERN